MNHKNESVDYACLSELGYGSFCPRNSEKIIEISLGQITELLIIESDYIAYQT